MDQLVLGICSEHRAILDRIGFDTTDEKVRAIFGGMYTARQIEYGGFGSDWFAQVALRFGKHAAEAMEVPTDNRSQVALKCSLLAPEVYKDLLPMMKPLLRMAEAAG